MKTLLFSYKFLFITFTTLPLAMCSNDETPDEETPIENSNDVTPSDNIETLYLTNFSRARIGERLPLLKARKITVNGNSNYRENLGLEDIVSIFSVSGGSYNTDNSFPTKIEDSYTPYDQNNVERNNVTISFVFSDEASSNATLTINSPVTFETLGGNMQDGSSRVFVREIKTGSFTIKARDERLNDVIPPLGKDKNGMVFNAFRFNDEEVSALWLNGLRYDLDGNSPVDIPHNVLVNMMKENNKVMPIKIIETAIVKDGQRIEPVTQPPNF